MSSGFRFGVVHPEITPKSRSITSFRVQDDNSVLLVMGEWWPTRTFATRSPVPGSGFGTGESPAGCWGSIGGHPPRTRRSLIS